MNRLLIAIFIIGTAAAGVHAEATATTPAQTGTTTKSKTAISKIYRLRLRELPSTNSRIVGYLAKGEEVSVVGKSTAAVIVQEMKGYWYEVVNSSGTHGWAFGNYLQIK